jgi:hypothetical protein
VVQSRRELAEEMNNWLDKSEANFRVPIRDAAWASMLNELTARATTMSGSVHYAVFNLLAPWFFKVQTSAERYLGHRDGTLVAISLEIYHRRHGRYPATLAELTPGVLPQIPADRITGDPVKYRLIVGKPVVYSVGADHIDDGGGAAISWRKGPDGDAAAQWNNPPAKARSGDWILYPSVGE